jgi:hypothetical protein
VLRRRLPAHLDCLASTRLCQHRSAIVTCGSSLVRVQPTVAAASISTSTSTSTTSTSTRSARLQHRSQTHKHSSSSARLTASPLHIQHRGRTSQTHWPLSFASSIAPSASSTRSFASALPPSVHRSLTGRREAISAAPSPLVVNLAPKTSHPTSSLTSSSSSSSSSRQASTAASRASSLAGHFSPSSTLTASAVPASAKSLSTSSASMASKPRSRYTARKIGAPHTLEHRIFIEQDGVPVSPFHDIPLYANEKEGILNMIVEVPRWTNAKMEVCAHGQTQLN